MEFHSHSAARWCVEQSHLIQELCSGTGVVEVKVIVEVTDVTSITGVTDVMDVTNITVKNPYCQMLR